MKATSESNREAEANDEFEAMMDTVENSAEYQVLTKTNATNSGRSKKTEAHQSKKGRKGWRHVAKGTSSVASKLEARGLSTEGDPKAQFNRLMAAVAQEKTH